MHRIEKRGRPPKISKPEWQAPQPPRPEGSISSTKAIQLWEFFATEHRLHPALIAKFRNRLLHEGDL